MNKNYRLLKFNPKGDSRGKLIALEGQSDIPFDIKRVFYIYDTEAHIERGKHANKSSEQVLICLCGKCAIIVDDGKNRESVVLNTSEIGLYIGKNIWREMKDFSQDCVLMVLTNEYYDANEYIRNYDEFLMSLKGS